MADHKIVRVQDISGLINQLYPQYLAEDWDNVGLQLGDPTATVDRVLVCLDVDEKVIDCAVAIGAQLIISHHPLIYRPLKKIVPTDEAGRATFKALREGVAVISAHTNLDRAKEGLNDWLAVRLGLQQATPLESGVGDLLKLVVFVPQGDKNTVMDALFATGAGSVGAYDRCSFSSTGTGSFRGDATTTPYIGTPGKFEQTEEVRIETLLPAATAGKVVAKMLKSHPYEEVAFDLYPLANHRSDVGLGRIGLLEAPLEVDDFLQKTKQALGTDHLRVAGPCSGQIKKVAVCGGSGVALLGAALRQGADCLVTGDVKYHDAQRARSEGLTLIDAGHFATEILMVKELSDKLKFCSVEKQWPLEIIEMTGERDPFAWV